jgi:hypothetical protein
MLRVETSFQDTPDGEYFFVLNFNGRPLSEQIDALGLKDGDTVILWEEDCGGYTPEATLLFDFRHPSLHEPGLWAKAKR